jgi:hypothetical protein
MAERACRRCLKTKPLADFRPSNAREGHERKRQRFDAALEAGDEPAEAVTACAECRAKVRAQANARVRACREHYHALRGAAPCVRCALVDPVCVHLYRRDEGSKVRPLSDAAYWSAKGRGVEAMREAAAQFEAVCKFCHSLRRPPREATAFDEWLDGRMVEAGAECACAPVTAATVRGFHFAHRDAAHKAVGMLELRLRVRGGVLTVDEAVRLAEREWRKGRLLCANCHERESVARTRANGEALYGGGA